MPTKKKRFGFIPREDVMKIIEKLSIENNLSNSKIISILVEEALSKRGIINKKTGKLSKLYLKNNDSLVGLAEDFPTSNDNEILTTNANLGNNKNFDKTDLLKQTNQELFDLHTYKKFLSFLKFQEMINEYNS